MIDMGLSRGAKALWKNDLLFDYTVEVEHREFKVHKLVLAAVSDYFHAMLTGTMQESQTDRVELKGLNAEAVSDLIELIYTGDDNIVNENGTDILQSAVYLQIPAAVEVCKAKLLLTLNEKNCLQMLSTFLACSFKDEAKKVSKFIQTKWTSVFEHDKLTEMPPEMRQFMIDNWERSEWDQFVFIKDWVEDDENQKKNLNDLMSLLRFGLMSPQEIADIKEMDIYLESDGSWRELVDQAAEYHNLPVHQKVLDESIQSTVRSDVTPFVFAPRSPEGMEGFLSLDSNNCWRINQYEALKSRDLSFRQVIVVNNYLIVCTAIHEGNKWYIYDPRRQTWAEIASMSRPKYQLCQFALTHHGEYLYVLGGLTKEDSKSGSFLKEVECYSLRNNTWTFTESMPVPVHTHSACVLGDYIYCSGGYTHGNHDSDRLDRFHVYSQKWESKAPMLSAKKCHKMGVIKINNEQVIVTIGFETFDGLNVEVYNPLEDTWTKLNVLQSCIRDLRLDSSDQHMIVLSGDTIFFPRLTHPSVKWTLPESGEEPTGVRFGKVPVPSKPDKSLCTGMLAFPSHIFL